jgi:hypothetical protein
MTPPRLLLTLAAALVPAAASAQPVPPDVGRPPTQTISSGGYEVFRWLLHRAELKPLTDAELRQGPFAHSDYVVVVLGSPQSGSAGQHSVSSWIDSALSRGGAVMVAYDSQAFLPLRNFPTLVQLQFGPWRAAAPPGQGFAGRPDSPFAAPVVRPALTAPEWQLFGGDRPLKRVATTNPGTINRPAAVGRVPYVLAEYPEGTRLAGPFGNRAPTANVVFAVGRSGTHPTTLQRYRFLALADQAPFQNELMIAPDRNHPTDNLEFADRVVSYLTEEDDQKPRTKRLLVVNGQVVRDYDQLSRLMRPPLPLPKLPPWEQLEPKLVDFGNQILDRVQENDVPNKLLVGPDPDAPGSRVRYLLAGLLVMAALWALVSLVRRVWGARQPTDLAPAPPGGRPPPPPDGAAGVFGRRGKELATRDNLLEPARAACRDLFDTVGRPPDPGPRLPKVVISDVVRKPDTLRQALRDLWAVAYGRPAPVTAMRWAALAPLVPRALAAHRDGKWRFVEAEAWPDVSTRPRGEA